MNTPARRAYFTALRNADVHLWVIRRRLRVAPNPPVVVLSEHVPREGDGSNLLQSA